MFLKQNINTIIAIVGVAAVGIGASYMIIRVASVTEFEYTSTEKAYYYGVEIQKSGNKDKN